jgi:hypothetical protein
VELEEGRLAGEAERLCAEPYAVSHAHRHHAYLARGRYADQLYGADAARLFADGGALSSTSTT